MLFKMKEEQLEAVKFLSLGQLNKIEKDLENILSINMFETLFEGNPLLVIFQERSLQAEPDIVALDRNGNTIVFELKRLIATGDTLGQLFRYVQKVQKWNYEILQYKFREYSKDKNLNLKAFHKESFGLLNELSEEQFNKHQKMIVIGHSADDDLIEGINYWKEKGVDIDFIPYRIYEIQGERYFEFFAKPHDLHSNPSEIKGVMFDTNRTYDENALQYMFDKKRISAFGDQKKAVYVLKDGDYVFFSHKNIGLVAAGKVKGKPKSDTYEEKDDENYYDVNFITPIPEKVTNDIKRLSFSRVSEITGKSFYWARTDKRPYLTKEEAEIIINEMKKEFNKN